ncbi:hypothetical protein C8R45DRAFT_939812 [Mycena sanguinolenta]|nr:hypothetical protein C8R45DRAFT_939812 [Mycena sanguinolenta]
MSIVLGCQSVQLAPFMAGYWERGCPHPPGPPLACHLIFASSRVVLGEFNFSDSSHFTVESLIVTLTTPFLLSNSNADINDVVTQTRDQFIRPNFNCNIQPEVTHLVITPLRLPHHKNQFVRPNFNFNFSYCNLLLRASSDFPDARPQVTVHVFLTLSACLIPPNRNSPRTAAIAVRQLRIREHRIPEQFLDSREHIVQKPRTKKGTVSAEAEVNQSNSVGEVVLDEAQLKQPEAPHADPEWIPFNGSPDVGAEESAAAQSGPQEATQEEETMTLRMRRLEAQMGALLAIGLPEGSPPSYYG